MKIFKNHKWSVDDVCIRCELKRKKQMNNKGLYDTYYLVNKKFTQEKQYCIPKTNNHDHEAG